MNLAKEDLKEIKKIVDDSVEKSADSIKKDLRGEIQSVATDLCSEIQASEERIITRINREVSDLADINRAALMRMDEFEYRLRIVERKQGIGAK